MGKWVQSAAQSWVVWELTHSESAPGIVVMLNSLPLLIFAPWVGGIAERLNRRFSMIATQVIAMFLAFSLALLIQTDLIQIWHFYLSELILGIICALDFPAQQAFIGDMSGMGQAHQTVTLNSMALQVARMIGLALGGFLSKQLATLSLFG